MEYVRVHDPRIVVPDTLGRRAVLDYLEIPRKLARAFDLLRLPDGMTPGAAVPESALESIELVEVKSTKKKLVHSPAGFFFGATANEFELAERLADRFKFCFVCLHPDTFGIAYKSLAELEPIIHSKRIQYQIKLTSHRQP